MSLLVAVVIVLGAAAVALLLAWLTHRRLDSALIINPTRANPGPAVGGTLFAVLLAFVILTAFQTYNGAKAGAASEAEAVLDMTRTTAIFPASQRDALRADLLCYGRAVVHQEWPAMDRGQTSPVVDGWITSYRALFNRLTLRSPREQLAFQELLSQAGTRTAGRLQRLSDDTPAVPTPLWVALIFCGCVAVALQFGVIDPDERRWVQGLLVAGVAAMVAAGLLVVNFLDHPYQGHVGALRPVAMERTLGMMARLEPGLRVPCERSGLPIKA